MALLRASLRRMDAYPERFGGLWLAPLRQELAEWLAQLERGEATVLLPYPRIYVEHAPDGAAPGPAAQAGDRP